MITYIYFNLFIAIISLKDLFVPKILNKILFIILSIILILFVGLRYEVGGDWVPYATIYYEAQFYDLISVINNQQDPLFYVLNYFIALSGFQNGLVFVNITISIFSFFTFYKFINYNKLNFLSFVIFYPFIVIILMGFVRQSIALGFLFLILSNNLEKNQKKNFLFAFLASQFHFSGYLLFLIPIFVLFTKLQLLLKPLNLFLLVFILFIFYIYVFPIFIFKLWVFDYYIDSSMGGLFKNFPILIASSIFIFSFISIFKEIENRNFYLTLSIFSVLCYLSIFLYGSLSDRILVYSIPLLILTFSKIHDFIDLSYLKILYYFSIITFFLLFMIVWLSFSNSSDAWIPYNLYLSKPNQPSDYLFN